MTTDVHELDFGLVRPNTPATRTVKIERSLAEIPAACKTVIKSVPPGVLRTEMQHSDENRERIIETWEVTLLADEQFQNHSGRLHLKFEGSDQGGVTLPVIGKIRKPVEVSPGSLFLGVGEPLAKVTKQIELTCDPGTKLKVLKSENIDQKMTFETRCIEVSQELSRVEVIGTFPAEEGSYVGRMRVECESPTGVTLEIPVTCVVRHPASFR